MKTTVWMFLIFIKGNELIIQTMRQIASTSAILLVLIMVAGSCGGGGGESAPATSTDTIPYVEDPNIPHIRLDEASAAVLQDGGPAPITKAEADAPPPLGASAEGTINSWYTPDKAFDGNLKSWWVGEVNRGNWDLFYGFDNARPLERISINFYGSDYVPSTITLKISVDGITWTEAGVFAAGNSKPEWTVTGDWKYLWIDMDGNPAIGYPLIRDVDWLPVAGNTGVSGGPGANDDWYFTTNAFDGDENTWWVGRPNAGAWDLYYAFETPRFIQMVTIKFYTINYIPGATNILASEDGYTWTDLGELGPGPNASPYTGYFYAGKSMKYLHIKMQGNPPSTYPLIKDISFEIPEGASSGDSMNTFYKAGNAFDGDDNTWWVGGQNRNSWDLVYRFPVPRYLSSVRVKFYSNNHTPQATAVYVSDDGETWTPQAPLPAGSTPVTALYATPRFLRFHFEGAPAVGYPLIKDIEFDDYGQWVDMGMSSNCSGIYDGSFFGSNNADVEIDANGQLNLLYDKGPILQWNGQSWAPASNFLDGGQTSFLFDSAGTPVTARSNYDWVYVNKLSCKANRLYLHKMVAGQWTEYYPGSATGNGLSNSIEVYEPDMILDNAGRPILVWQGANIYCNSGSGPSQIYARRWNGTNWERMGPDSDTVGIGISNSSSDSTYPELVLDGSGAPVVFWTETLSSAETAVYAKRWNGTEWLPMGSISSSGTGLAQITGTATGPSIVKADLDSNGNIWAAWTVSREQKYHIFVVKWDGSSWTDMSTDSNGASTISTNGCWSIYSPPEPIIYVTKNNIPVIAWDELAGSLDSDVHVKYFNGSAWVAYTGPEGSSIVYDTPEYVLDLELSEDPSGNPIVFWSQQMTSTCGTNQRIFARRWVP